MDSEIQQVLEEIVELGWVSIRDGRIVEKLPPKYNLCHFRWDRWSPTLKYLEDYGQHHPDFGGDFFVCLYDGWREYSIPSEDPTFLPWKYCDQKDKNYLGTGNAGEPRFRHQPHTMPDIYPELPLRVLTYNAHIHDRNAVVIPDSEFLEKEFASFRSDVRMYDVSWDDKISKIIWRGSPNTTTGLEYSYLGCRGMHPRTYLCTQRSNPNVRCVDASFDRMSIRDQLNFKYIMDVDGMVNAWSGLYWKLLSNSVVLKHKTHWYQWYYKDLVPWKHYIPMDHFEDLGKVWEWCLQNDKQCREIAEHATQFASKLTYEYAVRDFSLVL